MGFLTGIGAGIINGISIASLGYLKHVKEEGGWTTFNPAKFVETVVIGAGVGAIAGAQGVTYTQGYDWAASWGIIVALEWTGKAIWRRIKKYL